MEEEPQTRTVESRAFISRFLDIAEAEHPDYYSLPVKEKNAIMKEISDRIMKGVGTMGQLI